MHHLADPRVAPPDRGSRLLRHARRLGLAAALLGAAAAHPAGPPGTAPAAALPLAAAGAQPPPGGITLPRDEGSHPDWKTEWWYVTGWLEDAGGAPHGFQLAFFRNRGPADASHPSRFAPHQILLAHAAISDPQVGHIVHQERMERAGFGLAEAASDRLAVHIGDWELRRDEAGSLHAHVRGAALDLDLRLDESQPALLQGEQGLSRKGHDPRAFSWYYSLPQLRTSGTLRAGRSAAVAVHGSAWLDHEWSNAYLSDNAVGWDWTGLNFSDGAVLMAFRMRDPHGHTLWSSGSWRDAKGGTEQLTDGILSFQPGRVWTSPATGARYPVEWTLSWPGHELRLAPLFDDQEMDTRSSTATAYWEGAVLARPAGNAARTGGGRPDAGASRSRPATSAAGETPPVARGYLELTGYWRPLLF